jgi:hypothetical protein
VRRAVIVRRRSVGLGRGNLVVVGLEQLLGVLEEGLGVEILVLLDGVTS